MTAVIVKVANAELRIRISFVSSLPEQTYGQCIIPAAVGLLSAFQQLI